MPSFTAAIYACCVGGLSVVSVLITPLANELHVIRSYSYTSQTCIQLAGRVFVRITFVTTPTQIDGQQ